MLNTALLAVSLLLMTLNIIGVAGFLSAAYERQQIAAKATAHTAIGTAHAAASLIERQLTQAESNLGAGRTALIRAKDDRGRVKAAQAVVTTATAERDALATIGYAAPKVPQPTRKSTPVVEIAEPAVPVVEATSAPTVTRQSSRSRAAKKAWRTRRGKALVAARQRGLVRVK
jgi:hypothetical protein